MAGSKNIKKPDVLGDILNERRRQEKLWGEQDHGLPFWLMILGEEFGEVAKAMNEWFFRNAPIKDIRDELIQVAAVCIAIVESLDRNGQ